VTPSVQRAVAAAAFACAIALAAVAPAALGAQGLALKRDIDPVAAAGCVAEELPPPPVALQRDEAMRLVSQANEASILGDNRLVVELLQRATALNPTDPAIAYRLGRAYEELEAPDPALAQYCRALVLAPSSDEAPDARTRIGGLVEQGAGAAEAVVRQFRFGLEYHDRGSFREAERAFDYVLEQRPEWADAVYDRGVVRAARGDRGGAIEDLRRYLQLADPPGDAAAVAEQLAALGAPAGERVAAADPPERRPRESSPPAGTTRSTTASPGATLAQGLVVPGLGQFRTGRPAIGALIVAGVGASVYVALREEGVITTCDATDPFGNAYTYACPGVDRPGLAPGLGLAVAISSLAAVEAYTYVKRRQREAGGVAARLPLPTVAAGRGRVDLGFAISTQ
jgi:tetratricopeptide (TPR) repeat protein